MTPAALTFSTPGTPPLTASPASPLSQAHQLRPGLFDANATDSGKSEQKSIAPLLVQAESELERHQAQALVIVGSGGRDEEMALMISASKLGLAIGLVAAGTGWSGGGEVPLAARLADLLVIDPTRQQAFELAGLAPRTRVESSDQPAVAIVEEWLEQGAPRGDRGYGATR